jgi:hypothetical protein
VIALYVRGSGACDIELQVREDRFQLEIRCRVVPDAVQLVASTRRLTRRGTVQRIQAAAMFQSKWSQSISSGNRRTIAVEPGATITRPGVPGS